MPLSPVIDANFDFIIVGGGSAGCIMASRLSENPSNRVLVVEAGQDYAPGSEPEALRDPGAPTFFTPGYYRDVIGEGAIPSEGGVGVPVRIAQASLMGGGSAINGMHAQRGEASDYDDWRQLGVTGWSWGDVLPFFIKLETDLDFRGPIHGAGGPIKIKRQGPESWSELSRAVAGILESAGVPRVEDLNNHSGPGYGAVPLNATEHRVSSATAYLTADVRARKNLAILSNTTVRRLRFEGTRVRGVELMDAAKPFIQGSNVIVSCGALVSPELLLRSGIGPASALAEAGIQLVADRAGVGQNFQNHVWINLFAHLARAGRRHNAVRAPCLMVARLSSNHPRCPPADLIFNLWERTPGAPVDNPLGDQFADFMLILNKAYSVGEITLDPGNPNGPAKVRTRLLSDPRDLSRVVAAYRYLAELAHSDRLGKLVNDVFAMQPNPSFLALLQEGWKARTRSALGAIALGGPAKLRRFLLRDWVIPVQELLSDAATLEAHVRRQSGPTHSGGTCTLGDPRARHTVVDEHCRVIGVDGLRVVDASIFPRLMRAGTNLPTMMASEKAAHSIASGN